VSIPPIVSLSFKKHYILEENNVINSDSFKFRFITNPYNFLMYFVATMGCETEILHFSTSVYRVEFPA
jgi:hypothetical protein